MVCQQKCRTRSRRALPTRVACTTNGIQSCTISEPRVTELSLFSPVDGGFLLTCASCSRPISSRACRDLEDHTFKWQHFSSGINSNLEAAFNFRWEPTILVFMRLRCCIFVVVCLLLKVSVKATTLYYVGHQLLDTSQSEPSVLSPFYVHWIICVECICGTEAQMLMLSLWICKEARRQVGKHEGGNSPMKSDSKSHAQMVLTMSWLMGQRQRVPLFAAHGQEWHATPTSRWWASLYQAANSVALSVLKLATSRN